MEEFIKKLDKNKKYNKAALGIKSIIINKMMNEDTITYGFKMRSEKNKNKRD